ncbi:MAG TPA: type IV pilus assembly protein PilM [Planctomycetota bacterium]|nr:type IV pilus assembly protein PilM [Planctomycetota bacterium]
MARKVVWGVDIGQTALRAVKAAPAGDRIEILGFDSIEYEDILSAPDVDRDNAIQQALRTFLARNRVTRSDIVLACIPGQSALIRFIKLPPVEKKRVPDIVRYEAHQQIPFPLEEVVWDYKPLEKIYGPADQVEVGIFAMRRDIVHGFLSNLMVCGLDVDMLQLAPMALYNYVAYDRPGGAEGQIVIDMGAENTELLIYTGMSVWPRSLPVSGNDFTEAIMEKFKVPFGKAETLKRMAKQSKYSKQVYQAIEPVLRRLVEEVQRSIGYYKSINPGTRITGILALGGSFKLPGLAKYLSENLHLPIQGLVEPQNFDMSIARNPRIFQESALSFGVALGLVVQGCGLAGMDISLLPQELLQRKIIARKKPWAAAVAACALLMFGTAWYSTWRKGEELTEANSPEAAQWVKATETRRQKYEQLIDVTDTVRKLDEIYDLWMGRDFWLRALRKMYAPIPAEPDNEKGVWLKKVVSERIEFDTVAPAIADGVTNGLDSGLGLKADGMVLESGFLDRLKTKVKKPEWGKVGEYDPATGRPRQAAAEVKVQRPDVVYVVMQGETIHPDEGRYVTSALVKKLTNTWECTKCKVAVEDIEPPARCPREGCDGANKDFMLVNPPLIADVRFVTSQKEERFVNHMNRLVKPNELGETEQRTWQSILSRTAEMKAGKIRTWREGDRPGDFPLVTREQFLADLLEKRGVRLEMFTDFEIAFFMDPSGDLVDEVARLKEEEAKKTTQTGLGRGSFLPGRGAVR